MQTTNEWSCSISKMLDTLSGKWRLNTAWVIAKHDKIGFNQLKKQLPGITSIMLVRSLDALIAAGYVSKKLTGTKPPLLSEYRVTAKFLQRLPSLLALNALDD